LRAQPYLPRSEEFEDIFFLDELISLKI
jgi:hypothetical protein